MLIADIKTIIAFSDAVIVDYRSLVVELETELLFIDSGLKRVSPEDYKFLVKALDCALVIYHKSIS